eukprot:GHVH01008796.1.p1 GENE.GHVH01008796.1~~GHVH01008796.1.p1  ORF type:complete len:705 (+),score=122.41 GHVH01008796.1:24-2138(+)
MASPASPEERRRVCLADLTSSGVSFELHEHEPASTIELLLVALPKEATNDCVVKNLFMADKKKKQFLFCADSSSLTHAKVLIPKVAASQPLRFASPDRLAASLSVVPGSVSPISIVANENNDVELVFDEKIRSSEYVWVHPNDCTASLRMKSTDLVHYITGVHKKTIKWIDLSNAEAELAEAERTKGPPPKQTSAPAKAVKKQVEGSGELGITMAKDADFSEWYSQVITKAELIDYYDVSGCYVLRPSAFFMWETLQEFMNKYIKADDVENAYFPMFVTKQALEKEASHIEGFSPEVAWVTKSGSTDMAVPVAIRPTSETIMYPTFAKWIRSHRDLPLKINQWCPVVRWEFKQPTPFIRTREFLWQEGHTAHATDKEAMEQVLHILELYRQCYEDILAVPVVPGFKSTKERFAGGKMTTTVEAFIPTNGRAVQAATSHHLGQNFSKMFGVEFENQNKDKEFVHQTSWGFTTRSIGIAIMVHGDDKGLVLPPTIAKVQAVVVPIVFKEYSEEAIDKCIELEKVLKRAGIRAKADVRDNYTPGWKFNHWEVKGAALRIELGPRDLKTESVLVVRRDTGEKSTLKWSELEAGVTALLDQVYADMFAAAKKVQSESIVQCLSKEQVMDAVKAKKLVLVPWIDSEASEEEIKIWSASEFQKLVDSGEGEATGGIKSLCFPMDQPALPKGATCFWTGKPAEKWCLFGKSY